MQKRYGWVFAYILTIAGALALIHWGNRAVNVVAENLPLPRQASIVIDPGHGGEDGGATSCRGRLESSYNLEISLRLRDLLQLLGYSVHMTRTTDESLAEAGDTIARRKASDLRKRVSIVESLDSPILISIHQNQFPDRKYQGAQVFYAGTQGSEALADRLQTALRRNLAPGNRRQTKKSSGVYLMDHVRCPAVLIECGFLSNFEEESRLSDPGYQKKLSSVIAAAAAEFLSQP